MQLNNFISIVLNNHNNNKSSNQSNEFEIIKKALKIQYLKKFSLQLKYHICIYIW